MNPIQKSPYKIYFTGKRFYAIFIKSCQIITLKISILKNRSAFHKQHFDRLTFSIRLLICILRVKVCFALS